MSTVVITGAGGALGRRVARLALDDPTVERVVAIDAVERPRGLERVEWHAVDLLAADLKPLFEGADEVVHLASLFGVDENAELIERGLEVELARRTLDAAGAVGATRLVLLSSATVYGAWANNPIPLTEEAPVRPSPGFAYAVQKAEVERLAAEWEVAHPDAAVALLRPVPAVAEGVQSWLALALDDALSVRGSDDDPPSQFLHLDDLATAVDLARRGALEGPVNVAPDRWLTPGEFHDLASSGAPRVRLPDRVVTRLTDLRWRFRLSPAPPGVLAYTRGPWVVANDKLRAAGWEPTHSNEEAYVAGHQAGPLATLSPRRRQELALGVAGAAIAGLAAGIVALVRRKARRA